MAGLPMSRHWEYGEVHLWKKEHTYFSIKGFTWCFKRSSYIVFLYHLCISAKICVPLTLDMYENH
jgi:hypothetical protein